MCKTHLELLDAQANVETELGLDDDKMFVDEEAVIGSRHVCNCLVHRAQTRLPLAAIRIRLEEDAVQRSTQRQIVVRTTNDTCDVTE